MKNVTENSQDRSGSWRGKKLVVMCLQQQRTYSANKLNLQLSGKHKYSYLVEKSDF